MTTPSAPWWKQALGYFGVCVIESLLAMLLMLLHYTVLLPRLSGGTGGGYFCGFLGLLFLAPVFWLMSVVVFLVAKLLVIGLPTARRHWALVVYWMLAAGVIVYGLLQPHADHLNLGDRLLALAFGYGVALIPALVLTLSHFFLIPFFTPGGTARDALRALTRARRDAPASTDRPPAQG